MDFKLARKIEALANEDFILDLGYFDVFEKIISGLRINENDKQDFSSGLQKIILFFCVQILESISSNERVGLVDEFRNVRSKALELQKAINSASSNLNFKSRFMSALQPHFHDKEDCYEYPKSSLQILMALHLIAKAARLCIIGHDTNNQIEVETPDDRWRIIREDDDIYRLRSDGLGVALLTDKVNDDEFAAFGWLETNSIPGGKENISTGFPLNKKLFTKLSESLSEVMSITHPNENYQSHLDRTDLITDIDEFQRQYTKKPLSSYYSKTPKKNSRMQGAVLIGELLKLIFDKSYAFDFEKYSATQLAKIVRDQPKNIHKRLPAIRVAKSFADKPMGYKQITRTKKKK